MTHRTIDDLDPEPGLAGHLGQGQGDVPSAEQTQRGCPFDGLDEYPHSPTTDESILSGSAG